MNDVKFAPHPKYPRFQDITGRVYTRLTVLGYVGDRKWLCQCKCGKTRIVRKDSLTQKAVTSCGCLKLEKRSKPIVDIGGHRFGRLVAQRYVGKSSWECLCDCGKLTVVTLHRLKVGDTTSCGCYMREHMSRIRSAKLLGQRFGRLVVIEKLGVGSGGNRWLCRCDCGNTHEAGTGGLRNGGIQSCGCLQRELVAKRSTTHGMRKTTEYRIWTHIKQRCYSKANKDYYKYGARGIYVCDRWLNSFENFYHDMGPRPSDKHSIDRIDNDGPYSPGNCRWATARQQANNRKNNVRIKHNGEIKTVSQWARHFNVRRDFLANRLAQGQSLEEIIQLM